MAVELIVAGLLFALAMTWCFIQWIRIDNLKEDKRLLLQRVESQKEQIDTYQKALFGGERRGGE